MTHELEWHCVIPPEVVGAGVEGLNTFSRPAVNGGPTGCCMRSKVSVVMLARLAYVAAGSAAAGAAYFASRIGQDAEPSAQRGKLLSLPSRDEQV